MDRAEVLQRLRQLASEAAIRSAPKLLKTAQAEGLKVTLALARDALEKRVQAQVLAPPPRSGGKVYSEYPESKYAADLIDFSQNTNRPGGYRYILVLMQVWSRKLWATAMKDKTWEETGRAMRELLDEAEPSEEQTHELLHDAGLEFSRIERELPEGWVNRTKDPLDRQGLASLDKAIQTLKTNLEDIIEEKGGDWNTHLQAAVAAYNRAYHSAVFGPPNTAETQEVRKFFIDRQNAQNMETNRQVHKKKVDAVVNAGYFREATGARRAFHQQYGPKLKEEGVEIGNQYVKGSDDKFHLLKRVIPVHADSAEPKGKLVQPRQFKSETLRDLAEDTHADLINNPTRVPELALKLDPILREMDAKIKTLAFLRKFTDLFRIDDNVAHALVASIPATSSSSRARVKSVKPAREPRPMRTPLEAASALRQRKPKMTFWESLSYAYGNAPPSSSSRR